MSLDYAVMSKMKRVKDAFNDMPSVQDMILKNKCFAYEAISGEDTIYFIDFMRRCPDDINDYMELTKIGIAELEFRGMFKPGEYFN